MKKYNKNKKFDLEKVSGGLTLGGGLASGGSLNLIDKSKDTTVDKKTGTINKKDTTVSVIIDTDIKA